MKDRREIHAGMLLQMFQEYVGTGNFRVYQELDGDFYVRNSRSMRGPSGGPLRREAIMRMLPSGKVRVFRVEAGFPERRSRFLPLEEAVEAVVEHLIN